jgi:hypothetical protein
MKRLIPFLIICFFISGCRNDQYKYAMNRVAEDTGDKTDTTSYPLLIDGGTKIVYQFGHLTADKGLKLYLDTIDNPAKGLLYLNDSVRRHLPAQ